MAVRLDLDELLTAVGPEVAAQGQRYAALVGGVEADGGGASARVERLDVWVGVVNGELVGECDCVEDGLCAHAVAVALATARHGVVLSSRSTRDDRDPEEQRFATVAGTLGRRKLIGLVAARAVADRHFAAALLAAAGRLPAPGPEDIKAARRVVEAAEEIPNGRHRWQLPDLVAAGKDMLVELDILAERPATVELLDVVEEAIAVWTDLLRHLGESWEDFDTDPVTSGLADLHLRMCAACDLPPVELAARLVEVLVKHDEEPFLDLPDAYADLLGDEGIEEFRSLTE